MRHTAALMLYLGLFSALFFLALWGMVTRTALVDVGLAPSSIDMVIAALSLLGIVKSVWHLASG